MVCWGCAAITDLGRMYFLFSREPATLEYIKDSMRNLVRETGTNIVKDEENLKVCQSHLMSGCYRLSSRVAVRWANGMCCHDVLL